MIQTIVGVCILAAGCWLLFHGFSELWDVVVSRRWQTTSGVIVVSDLQWSSGVEGGHMYRAEICYRFVVDGQEFVGARARFGDAGHMNRSAPAVRLTRKYRPGTVVTVHYDPDDPSESVLEPGLTWQVVTLLALGSVVVGAAVLTLAAA